MRTKFLTLFLAVTVSLTVWNIPAQAEIENEAENVERKGEKRRLPEDPAHSCTNENDGSDTTTWSYVYFGSYPQTEVTGDALTAPITEASYDAGGDAWVNGTKYRRISRSDTNNTFYFGNSEYRYFKWEKIKWRVLNVNESTMFIAADIGLDCKFYNDKGGSVTWENSTIRKWLNNDFHGTAFNRGEQSAIVEQTVVNEDNPEYHTDGGNDTRDKVYLLSIREVTNVDYGFCKNSDISSVSRRIKTSDYAHARGASVENASECALWWFLRTPGLSSGLAMFVNHDGSVDWLNGVSSFDRTCVPVLHIDLSSDLWFMEDDGNSGDVGGSGTGAEGGSQDQNAETDINTPPKTVLKGKPKALWKAFAAKWKKQTGISGYQIQYSTDKKFGKKGKKIKTIKKPSKTKLTINKLKAEKKYYVRIRTYKVVSGKDFYSGWSKAKTVKVK